MAMHAAISADQWGDPELVITGDDGSTMAVCAVGGQEVPGVVISLAHPDGTGAEHDGPMVAISGSVAAALADFLLRYAVGPTGGVE